MLLSTVEGYSVSRRKCSILIQVSFSRQKDFKPSLIVVQAKSQPKVKVSAEATGNVLIFQGTVHVLALEKEL